jgi:cupin 2 domain-containing protein
MFDDRNSFGTGGASGTRTSSITLTLVDRRTTTKEATREIDRMILPHNLFANLPASSRDELFATLLERPGLRIERIVSYGQASPEGFWYDEAQGEWVVVLKGSAKIRFEDRVVDLKPGDYLDLPAHTRHRVEATSPDEPTVWLAVHYGEPSG